MFLLTIFSDIRVETLLIGNYGCGTLSLGTNFSEVLDL